MARSLCTPAAWILAVVVAAHWAAVAVEAPDVRFDRSGLEPRLERAADVHPSTLPRAVRITAQAEWKLGNPEFSGQLLGIVGRGDSRSHEGAQLVAEAAGGILQSVGDHRRYDPRAPPG